jgi:N-methylhydantoinase A
VALNGALDAVAREVRELLAADGVAPEDVVVDRSAQMRYIGQSYEVTTPLPDGELDAAAVTAITAEFNAVHQREYGVASSDFPVAFVTLRATGVGRTSKPGADELAEAMSPNGRGNGDGSVKERRRVYFGGEHHEVDVHDMARLSADQKIDGPAIIEQRDGVIVLPPGAVARADRYDNVLVSTQEEEA